MDGDREVIDLETSATSQSLAQQLASSANPQAAASSAGFLSRLWSSLSTFIGPNSSEPLLSSSNPQSDLSAMADLEINSSAKAKDGTIKTLRKQLALLSTQQDRSNATISQQIYNIKQLEDGLNEAIGKYEGLEKWAFWREDQLKAMLKESTAALELKTQHLRSAKLELGEVKKENAKLDEDLEKCKNQIFDMHPDDTVSDKDVKDKYEGLREAITDWVDTKFGDASGYFGSATVQRLGKAGFTCFERAFLHNQVPVSQAFPEAEGVFAGMVVRQYLEDNILGGSVHFLGLSDQNEKFLSDAGRALKNNKHPSSE